jgi:hypothetical protein
MFMVMDPGIRCNSTKRMNEDILYILSFPHSLTLSPSLSFSAKNILFSYISSQPCALTLFFVHPPFFCLLPFLLTFTTSPPPPTSNKLGRQKKMNMDMYEELMGICMHGECRSLHIVWHQSPPLFFVFLPSSLALAFSHFRFRLFSFRSFHSSFALVPNVLLPLSGLKPTAIW